MPVVLWVCLFFHDSSSSRNVKWMAYYTKPVSVVTRVSLVWAVFMLSYKANLFWSWFYSGWKITNQNWTNQLSAKGHTSDTTMWHSLYFINWILQTLHCAQIGTVDGTIGLCYRNVMWASLGIDMYALKSKNALYIGYLETLLSVTLKNAVYAEAHYVLL